MGLKKPTKRLPGRSVPEKNCKGKPRRKTFKKASKNKNEEREPAEEEKDVQP